MEKKRKEKKRKHAIFEYDIKCKIKYIGAVKNNT